MDKWKSYKTKQPKVLGKGKEVEKGKWKERVFDLSRKLRKVRKMYSARKESYTAIKLDASFTAMDGEIH